MIVKRAILTTIILLVALVFYACFSNNIFGENISFVDMEYQVFPVLGKGQDTQVAIGLTAGVYPEEVTIEEVRAKVAELSEEERMEIPEYVLMKQQDLIVKGDLDGLISLYEIQADKDYARARFSNIEKMSEERKNVVRIVLKAKVSFGPYVYIKYQPIVKEGMSFSFCEIMKRTESGYLFSVGLSGSIFNSSAESFPYWEDAKIRNDYGELNGMQKSTFKLQGVEIVLSDDSPLAGTGVDLYYKIENFSEAVSSSDKEGIQQKLNNILYGYKDDNYDEIIKAWEPSLRSDIFIINPNKNESSRKEKVWFYEKIEKIEPKYCIQSGEALYVYTILTDISGGESTKLFEFWKTQGEYFLDNPDYDRNISASFILHHSAFLEIIEKQ